MEDIRYLILMAGHKEARRSLEKVENTKEFPEDLRAEFYLVYADYYIRTEDYEKAADKISEALRYIKKRKERWRPAFIYAQLLQKQQYRL